MAKFIKRRYVTVVSGIVTEDREVSTWDYEWAAFDSNPDEVARAGIQVTDIGEDMKLGSLIGRPYDSETQKFGAHPAKVQGPRRKTDRALLEEIAEKLGIPLVKTEEREHGEKTQSEG